MLNEHPMHHPKVFLDMQVILETQGRVCQELEALKVETTNVLEEERSKTAALLAVDSAALHPGQLQLLRDNQKLLLQLHRSQEQLTVGPLHPQ